MAAEMTQDESANVRYLQEHELALKINEGLQTVLQSKPPNPCAVLSRFFARPTPPPRPLRAKLYGSSASANSVQVLFAAAAMRVPHDWVEVDMVKGEHKTPEYLAVNFRGQVPAMVVDALDLRLGESCTIMRTMANVFPVDDLWYPCDPVARARVDYALDWRQTVLYPVWAKATYPAVGFLPVATKSEWESTVEGSRRELLTVFDLILASGLLGPVAAGTAGAHPTIADCSLAITFAGLYHASKAAWPPAGSNAEAYLRNARAAFDRVAPGVWDTVVVGQMGRTLEFLASRVTPPAA